MSSPPSSTDILTEKVIAQLAERLSIEVDFTGYQWGFENRLAVNLLLDGKEISVGTTYVEPAGYVRDYSE